MFSTKVNIQQLTSLMLKAYISDVVVCPGSRNAPIAHTFNAAGMRCYNITDERSAGFFALGLAEARGGKPVAVCCTSGSAVLNLAPAVAEAYYQNLPLLVVTADRPERWIGQKDGQTMVQPGAFSGFVCKTVSLPEPECDDDRWYCNRLVNEAFVEMWKCCRPVHINVPITEPMFDFSALRLPDERLIRYNCGYGSVMSGETLDALYSATRPMLILGQMLPSQMSECAVCIRLFAEKGWAILAENLSNAHTDAVLAKYIITDFDDILAGESPCRPDLVVTLGGHIVSKRLKRYLRLNQPERHIHVCMNGEVEDLFQCMTDLVVSDACSALRCVDYERLLSGGRTDYCDEWRRVCVKEDLPALSALFELLSAVWTVQVANSSVVRKMQKVFSGSNPVFCNRGINGIEGCVSAAVGYWTGSKCPTILLIGDLSFFYDQNGLWNNYVRSGSYGSPLRILIINNQGGDIFYGLPGLDKSRYLASSIAASHDTTASGIAEECGCVYYSVRSYDEYADVLPQFLSMDNDVRILELFSKNY